MAAMNDASMLELFRIEAETHAATLEQGLLGLESDQRSERVEPLMRAAHSLKGAARIVGLPPVVELTHAMEDLLESCRKGEARLASGDIDLLLAATDILKGFAGTSSGEMQQAVGSRAPEMADLARLLKAGPGVGPVEAAAPKIQQPSGRGASEGKAPCAAQPPKAAEQAPAQTTIFADPAMLGLFLAEAGTFAAAVEKGTARLDTQEAPDAALTALASAARSLRGAARIVGLPAPADLARDMEEAVEASRNAGTPLPQAVRAALTETAGLFSEIASASVDTLAGLLDSRAEALGRIRETFRPAPEPAPPAPTAPTAPAEPEAAPAPSPESEPAGEAAGKTSPPPPAPPPAPVEDGVVRVSASTLSRLMGLAGEALIEARGLVSLTDSLMEIKAAHEELARAVEDALPPRRGAPAPWSESLGEARALLARHAESVEQAGLTLENICERLYAQVIKSRMRPFEEGVAHYPRMLRDLARELGKKIELVTLGQATRVDRDIMQRMEAPLTHLLRNAADHGMETPEERAAAGKPETGRIVVEARHSAGMLIVSIADDGRGIDLTRLRAKICERGLATPAMAEAMDERELTDFLFLPGFTTTSKVTEVSGRGVGLDVVHSMVQSVGGSVSVETRPGNGATFTLKLPLTLSVLRTLLVEIGGEPYALPLARIDRVERLPREEIRTVEGRQYADIDGERLGLVEARQVLGLDAARIEPCDDGLVRVVVVSDRMGRFGLAVERLLGERDLVVRPLDPMLGKVQDVSAAAFLEDGSAVIVLDADDLARSLDRLLSQGRLARVEARAAATRRARRVLVVDDSLTVREVERSLLSGRSYEVETAVDGVEGLNMLRAGRFDLVVTDVDMPRMNGVELTRTIKGDPELSALPVLIVSYKDREEDRMRGLEAGADYYLTKSSFHDESLVAAVRDLIGDALGHATDESPERAE